MLTCSHVNSSSHVYIVRKDQIHVTTMLIKIEVSNITAP